MPPSPYIPGSVGGMDTNNLGSQLGMINALRTGNPLLDMVIVMLIPVFFQMLFQVGVQFQPLYQRLLIWLRAENNFIMRHIEFECRTTAWGSVIKSNGKEERNNILQKAIILYIGEIKDLKFENGKISLMAVQEKGKRDQESYEMVYGSTADQLKQYSVNILPPNNQWVVLKSDKANYLEFMQSSSEEENEGDKKDNGPRKNVTIFHFKTSKDCGEKIIDAFIQESFDWYVERVRANQDNGRYLYMLVKSPTVTTTGNEGNGEGESAPNRVYKRYRLSDEKSFASLFFKEKEMLVKLLLHFEKKTGKYGIRGFPHKLGLLLHGPPGTGKTSLIKALAQHTQRNVVSISLSRIETNQELMDIVFDQSFAVKGEDMPIKLSFKDIIFVMEDVDAASPIVHARSAKEDEPEDKPSKLKLQRQTSTGGTTAAPVVSSEVIEVVKDGEKDTKKGDADPSDTELVMAMISSLADDTGTTKKSSVYKYSSPDKLDLAGLLNVLDGVVDCPNRILVMTTNHPEKLDPALIRPGRIDKIVYLGYMQAAEAKQMVEHYFQTTVTEAQYTRLANALSVPLKSTPALYKLYGERGFTPAELEQLCAEYDTIDEFLTNLEDRVLKDSEAGDAFCEMPDLSRKVSSVRGDHQMPSPVPLRRGLSH